MSQPLVHSSFHEFIHLLWCIFIGCLPCTRHCFLESGIITVNIIECLLCARHISKQVISFFPALLRYNLYMINNCTTCIHLVILGICIHSCYHHHNQGSKHTHHCQTFPCVPLLYKQVNCKQLIHIYKQIKSSQYSMIFFNPHIIQWNENILFSQF